MCNTSHTTAICPNCQRVIRPVGYERVPTHRGHDVVAKCVCTRCGLTVRVRVNRQPITVPTR